MAHLRPAAALGDGGVRETRSTVFFHWLSIQHAHQNIPPLPAPPLPAPPLRSRRSGPAAPARARAYRSSGGTHWEKRDTICRILTPDQFVNAL